MLNGPKRQRALRKSDWFPTRFYKHFDQQLSREDASALVTDPERVARHAFLPFLTFEKLERRYRRTLCGTPTVKIKRRTLSYCSNKDACIFAFYAAKLSEAYEAALCERGLEDVVIGYRKVGSTVELALQAFNEIRRRKRCVALAFDIQGFFDNIDHNTLKAGWGTVIGSARLPADHFQVFRHLTSHSSMSRSDVLERLGHRAEAKDFELPSGPLCSAREFRKLLRASHPNLIKRARGDKGIPQGSPISAVAANVSMLAFDTKLHATIQSLGGTYRRYSDDILIIVPDAEKDKATREVTRLLALEAGGLCLNVDKTAEVAFNVGTSAPPVRPLQYLGLIFDGDLIRLRPSTLSRYWRRVHKEVRRTQWMYARASVHDPSARIHLKRLLRKTTHLGGDSLLTTYVAAASRATGSKAIRRQFAGHERRIRSMIKPIV